jgi:hypothetical protein
MNELRLIIKMPIGVPLFTLFAPPFIRSYVCVCTYTLMPGMSYWRPLCLFYAARIRVFNMLQINYFDFWPVIFRFLSLKAQFKELKNVKKHIKRHFQSLYFVKCVLLRTFGTILWPFCLFLLHL